MIKVVAKHFVKPEKLDEFIALSKQLVEDTNEKDRGCISYALHQSMADPLVVAMIEEWENREAADEHLKAKHFNDNIGAMVTCLSGPSDITYYNVL